MKTAINRILIVAMLISIGACSNFSVNTDYVMAHDFADYQVYQWHPSGPPQTDHLNRVGGDIFHQRLLRLTDNKLTAKGFSRGDTPQFYINYSVVTQEQIAVNNYTPAGFYGTSWGWPYGWGYGYSMAYTDTQVRYYTQGTVIIDIIDAAKNELVWRGSAQRKLRSASTAEQNEADLSELLDVILANFPPNA